MLRYEWVLLMEKDIQVKEKHSGEILFQTTYSQLSQAYAKAKEFEEMGLEVELETPPITVSLIKELGARPEEIQSHLQSCEDEIESHND